jgi:hypothetical protein
MTERVHSAGVALLRACGGCLRLVERGRVLFDSVRVRRGRCVLGAPPRYLRASDSASGSTSATEGQPPPSQQPSTFCRQSSHHQAERIQKRRWGRPVIAQSIAR